MKRLLPLVVLVVSGCAGAQLAKLKAQNEELREKAGALLVDVKTKTDAADSAQAALTQAQAMVAELEEKLSVGNSQIESLAKSNTQLSNAVGASQDELGGKLQEAIAQKDALAQKLADLQKERQTLERLKNIYRSARDKASADAKKLQAERDALTLRLSSCAQQQSQASQDKSVAAAKIHEEMGSIVDAVLKDVQSGRASVSADEIGFSITIDNSLMFDDGAVKIREEGVVFLEKAGKALKALGPREIAIAAHTDNAPVKKGLLGGYEDNWALSAGRAAAVVRWLHQHSGLDPTRLKAEGCAEFRPLKPNDSEESRAGNRRLVITVQPGTP